MAERTRISLQSDEGIDNLLDTLMTRHPLTNKSALLREALRIGLCTFIAQLTVNPEEVQVMLASDK